MSMVFDGGFNRPASGPDAVSNCGRQWDSPPLTPDEATLARHMARDRNYFDVVVLAASGVSECGVRATAPEAQQIARVALGGAFEAAAAQPTSKL